MESVLLAGACGGGFREAGGGCGVNCGVVADLLDNDAHPDWPVYVEYLRFKAELFDFFRWPMTQILEDSPPLVAERDAEEQFRTWLKLWPACSTVGSGMFTARQG